MLIRRIAAATDVQTPAVFSDWFLSDLVRNGVPSTALASSTI